MEWALEHLYFYQNAIFEFVTSFLGVLAIARPFWKPPDGALLIPKGQGLKPKG